MSESRKRFLAAFVLVIVALLSGLLVASHVSTERFHERVFLSIDDKTETVLKLTSSATVASAAISAIPDDTATPIAEKLADFTEYFLLILCVLYTEKYLLPIIGILTFRFLIPASCVAGIIGIYTKNANLKQIAWKTVIVGLALYVTIPASTRLSDAIYDGYQDTITATITSTSELSEATSFSDDDGQSSGLGGLLSGIRDSVKGLTNRAASLFNGYLESLAVMAVTSCVIPILGLVFFLWVTKLVTGADFLSQLDPRTRHKRGERKGAGGTERAEQAD